MLWTFSNQRITVQVARWFGYVVKEPDGFGYVVKEPASPSVNDYMFCWPSDIKFFFVKYHFILHNKKKIDVISSPVGGGSGDDPSTGFDSLHSEKAAEPMASGEGI